MLSSAAAVVVFVRYGRWCVSSATSAMAGTPPPARRLVQGNARINANIINNVAIIAVVTLFGFWWN